MWRRVPCEQPLHKAQSILSPRQTAMLYAVVRVRSLCSQFFAHTLNVNRHGRKGTRSPFRYLDAEPLSCFVALVRARTRLRSIALDEGLVGVTRKDPEKLRGAPGRVIFSVSAL